MIDHDNLKELADPYAYDREDSSDTGVAFYAALARETGGPVLEIACGTGRVATPIARLGLAVTGLDIVPGMLELARRKAAGLATRWVEGDARAFDLGERFRLVFLTGNAFQAFLTRADREALFGARARAPARRGPVRLRDAQRRRRGTTSPRSCTGRPTGAGARASGSRPRSRASRCATPSRRSRRRCCTTTASPSSGSTGTGTRSR